MEEKIENIGKTAALDLVFHEYMTHDNEHPYDFFMRLDTEATQDLYDSELGTKYGFVASDEYSLDNVRSIRGVLQQTFYQFMDFYNAVEKMKASENTDVAIESVLGDGIDDSLDGNKPK